VDAPIHAGLVQGHMTTREVVIQLDLAAVCGDQYVRSRADHLPPQMATRYNRKSIHVEEARPIDGVLLGAVLPQYRSIR
jgi:hypothetical protein